MTAVDLWRSIFRARYAPPQGAAGDPAKLAEAYARFYRGHHGPCDLKWAAGRTCWAFADCQHAASADVCAAHQGFALGLLDATLGREVALAEWTNVDGRPCKLIFTWEEP